MSFKPNLTRKLYETTLSLDKIVHPEKLKAQTDPGEDESNVSPIKWHPLLSDTKLYVTMWEDWLSDFNALNGNTLKKTDADGVNLVKAKYADEMRSVANLEITNKYTEAELAVPTDAIKDDIAAINARVQAEYDTLWDIS